MNPQTLARAAVDGSLRLLRLPADVVAHTVDARSRDGVTAPMEVALDRADAALRDAAGRLLHDPGLQDDARRRRAASEGREQARRVRAEARRRSREADEELTAEQEEAERRRRAATQAAKAKEVDAQRRRKEATTRVREAETLAREAVQSHAEQTKAAIEHRARHTRLEQLDTEREALEEQERALTARSEAQRLRRAAAEAKSDRKAARD